MNYDCIDLEICDAGLDGAENGSRQYVRVKLIDYQDKSREFDTVQLAENFLFES